MVTIKKENGPTATADTLERATELFQIAIDVAADAKKTTGQRIAEAATALTTGIAGNCVAVQLMPESAPLVLGHGANASTLATFRAYLAILIDKAIADERDACAKAIIGSPAIRYDHLKDPFSERA